MYARYLLSVLTIMFLSDEVSLVLRLQILKKNKILIFAMLIQKQMIKSLPSLLSAALCLQYLIT